MPETLESKVEDKIDTETTENRFSPKRKDQPEFDTSIYLNVYIDKAKDKFISPKLLRWFNIPPGYNGVRLRMSRWASVIKPGFRFVLGLDGFWGSVALVDMRLKSRELPMLNVITGDNLEMPQVKAVVNYQVYDPIKALLGGQDYRNTVENIAEATIRKEVQSLTLRKLSDIAKEDYNFATDEKNQPVRFPELDQVGVRMPSLYLTQLDFPNELRELLAQRAIADAEAEKEYALASKRIKIAEIHARAAVYYKNNPEAKMLLNAGLLDELIKNQKINIFTGTGGLIENIAELIGRKSA